LSRKVTHDQVRKIACSLPESTEQDHHGIPSFRIDEKIFATLWDPTHLNVMLSPKRIMDVAKENPESCKEFWWGRTLRCVQVDLTIAGSSLVSVL
jgi:hypothetical protein